MHPSIELLLRARRMVFVQLNAREFLTITAQRHSMELSWWYGGMRQPLQTIRVEESAETLGLFDRWAWNIPALDRWLKAHCIVCFKPLNGKQERYHSNACKQKAYRQRKKEVEIKGRYEKYRVINIESEEEVSGAFVLKPEVDIHARVAILAYARSIEFENPVLAVDLEQWMNFLNQESPIALAVMPTRDELPQWLIDQSRGQS